MLTFVWMVCASVGIFVLLSAAMYVTHGVLYAEWNLVKQQELLDRFTELRIESLEAVGVSYTRYRVVSILAILAAFLISGYIFF